MRFDITAEDYERVFAAFFNAGNRNIEKSRHRIVYLDTPDSILREQDIFWCFSRKDKLREVGLKAGEWRLDRDCGARSYVKKHRLFNKLGGVFTASIDRESVMHRAGDIAVEIGLECTKLQSGDQSEIVREAHFTLKDGDAEALLHLLSDVLPQAEPLTHSAGYVLRGYALCDMASSQLANITSEADVSMLTKAMRLTEAFKFVVRAELHRALAQPLPSDGPSIQKNIHAARCVQSAYCFFGRAVAPNFDRDRAAFTEWETVLQKTHGLDMALNTYLKPTLQRNRWEGAPAIIARIEDNQKRAFTTLIQSWPKARVETLFSDVLERLDADASYSAGDNEGLVPFISAALAKATEDIQKLGHALVEGIKHRDNGKAKADDIRRLSESATYLQDVIAFLEPLTKGKAARRRVELHEALSDLQVLLDKDQHLHYAQALVEDAAAHLARLKQTKTQSAQTYAAGALAGYLEAKKLEDPAKALKKALANLSDVKPFWTKID